jgi:hypothetical protein
VCDEEGGVVVSILRSNLRNAIAESRETGGHTVLAISAEEVETLLDQMDTLDFLVENLKRGVQVRDDKLARYYELGRSAFAKFTNIKEGFDAEPWVTAGDWLADYEKWGPK